MTVGPDLLKAAEANDPAAIDMVSIWGLGFSAELGGSLAPGLWMHSGAQRVLQQCRPGVLYNDLAACNAYQNALARRATLTSAHDAPARGARLRRSPRRQSRARRVSECAQWISSPHRRWATSRPWRMIDPRRW